MPYHISVMIFSLSGSSINSHISSSLSKTKRILKAPVILSLFWGAALALNRIYLASRIGCKYTAINVREKYWKQKECNSTKRIVLLTSCLRSVRLNRKCNFADLHHFNILLTSASWFFKTIYCYTEGAVNSWLRPSTIFARNLRACLIILNLMSYSAIFLNLLGYEIELSSSCSEI